MSAVPTAPAVEVMSCAEDTIPAAALDLLRRGECSLVEAGEFLGFAGKGDGTASSTVYAMADHYRRRTEGVMFNRQGYPKPYDPRQLIPQMRNGRWIEIPNTGANHVYRVDTRYLVPMRYPRVGWPGVQT